MFEGVSVESIADWDFEMRRLLQAQYLAANLRTLNPGLMVGVGAGARRHDGEEEKMISAHHHSEREGPISLGSIADRDDQQPHPLPVSPPTSKSTSSYYAPTPLERLPPNVTSRSDQEEPSPSRKNRSPHRWEGHPLPEPTKSSGGFPDIVSPVKVSIDAHQEKLKEIGFYSPPRQGKKNPPPRQGPVSPASPAKQSSSYQSVWKQALIVSPPDAGGKSPVPVPKPVPPFAVLSPDTKTPQNSAPVVLTSGIEEAGEPDLVVEIALDGVDTGHRIEVRKGDSGKELARRYCEKHGLGSRDEDKLTAALSRAISQL